MDFVQNLGPYVCASSSFREVSLGESEAREFCLAPQPHPPESRMVKLVFKD